MSLERGRVVVIGSGVIGISCAYYLSQQGWRVTVIDRGKFRESCSYSNCGLICPSHVLPLAEPGAVSNTMAALLKKNSPFYIRPRFDVQLLRWLLNFAGCCRQSRMLASAQARKSLLRSSFTLYQQLLQVESIECDWQTKGLLLAFRDADEFERFGKTACLIRERFQEPVTRCRGDAVREIEPALKEGLAGGYYFPDDAHMQPEKLVTEWRKKLQSRGVEFVEHCELRQFVREGGAANRAITSQGEITADVFVVALGARTPLLGKQLGCSIPIQPGKGYTLTSSRPATCPDVPIIFPETRVAVTPMPTEFRLGSTMEFVGYDTTISPQRLGLLKSGVRPFLQDPEREYDGRPWFGWRPMTYDGLPILDRAPAMANVWIAAGHNMVGLSMAPATGLLMAELISGQEPHIDPTPFQVSRF